MSDTPTQVTVAEFPAADETWHIEIDHAQFYAWEPIRIEDIPTELAEDGSLVEVGGPYIDSYYRGFKMRRIVVDEPTTTKTAVHVPSLKSINDERKAAGLGPKPHHANLTRHLEDGPWPKHFPLESVTAVRCDHPGIEAKLHDYFVGGIE